MICHYAEIKDGKVLACYNGPLPEGPQYEVIPEFEEILPGQDRRNWDSAWNIRPRADRVADGLLEVPQGKKLENGIFVDLTLGELIAEGASTRPSGFILSDDGTAWRQATVTEQVALGDITLAEFRGHLKRQIDAAIPAVRKAGFEYQGTVYQADPGVTEALNGVLIALSAGVAVSFPIRWRSGDNARPSWTDAAAFVAFAGAVLTFVDEVYQQAFDDKDGIEAAASAAEAQAIFEAGPWA